MTSADQSAFLVSVIAGQRVTSHQVVVTVLTAWILVVTIMQVHLTLIHPRSNVHVKTLECVGKLWSTQENSGVHGKTLECMEELWFRAES